MAKRRKKYFKTGGYSTEFTPTGAGKRYLLTRIPGGLWTEVRRKAKDERTSLRTAILRLLRGWVDGSLTRKDS